MRVFFEQLVAYVNAKYVEFFELLLAWVNVSLNLKFLEIFMENLVLG